MSSEAAAERDRQYDRGLQERPASSTARGETRVSSNAARAPERVDEAERDQNAGACFDRYRIIFGLDENGRVQPVYPSTSVETANVRFHDDESS